MNQHLIHGILKSMNCMVTLVNNGQLAIDAVLTNHFDVVFMDIQMPVLNGILATEHIRSTNHSKLPIIAMVGTDDTQKYELELSTLFNGTISKPFSREKVVDCIAPYMKVERSKPELPLVNLQRLEEMCSNDRDIIRHLAATFQTTTPQLISEFNKGLAAKDGTAMYNANHQLKAAFSMFQARIPLQLSLKLELLLKVNPLNESLITELSTDMKNALDAVYIEIDRLAND